MGGESPPLGGFSLKISGGLARLPTGLRGPLFLCNLRSKRGLDPAWNFSPSSVKLVSTDSDSLKLGMTEGKSHRITGSGTEQKAQFICLRFLLRQRPPRAPSSGPCPVAGGGVNPTRFPVPVGASSLGLMDKGHGRFLQGDLVPTFFVAGVEFHLKSSAKPPYPLVRDQDAILFSALQSGFPRCSPSNTTSCYCSSVISMQGLDSLKDFCLPNVY